MKTLIDILPVNSHVFVDRLQQTLAFAKSRETEVYLVGGSARLFAGASVYCTRELTDLDILVVNDPITVQKFASILKGDVTGEMSAEGMSSCAGQKFEVKGIKCDVFGNDLYKWINGAPCYGDMFAIDFDTGMWSLTVGFLDKPCYDVNPGCNTIGKKAEDYMPKHRDKLARDIHLVENIRQNYAGDYHHGPLL